MTRNPRQFSATAEETTEASEGEKQLQEQIATLTKENETLTEKVADLQVSYKRFFILIYILVKVYFNVRGLSRLMINLNDSYLRRERGQKNVKGPTSNDSLEISNIVIFFDVLKDFSLFTWQGLQFVTFCIYVISSCSISVHVPFS